MKDSDDLVVEQKFHEFADFCLELHENFQNGFDDARTAFNEQFEDEEPFDVAEMSFDRGFKESCIKVAELEKKLLEKTEALEIQHELMREKNKEMDMKDKWVKHHQTCLEFSKAREKGLNDKITELVQKLAEAEKDLGKWLGIASDNDQLFLNEKFQKTHAEEKLKVAVEALTAYASPFRWNHSKDPEFILFRDENHGYEIARDALLKIKE